MNDRQADPHSLLEQAVQHDTQPREHTVHPDLARLFAALSDEMPGEERSVLSAHLATCSDCRERWDGLATLLSDEQQVLDQRVRTASLDVVVRNRMPETLWGRLRTSWKTFVAAPTGNPMFAAAAASVVAVGIALAVALPLLQPPVRTTADQVGVLVARVEHLQRQVESLAQGSISIPAGIASSQVTHEVLARFDWQSLRPYVVRPLEDWETISETELGDAALWPLLWLLNGAAVDPDNGLTSGKTVVLPTRAE